MKIKISPSTAIFGGVLGAILAISAYFALTPQNLSEGVNFAAEQNDPELPGAWVRDGSTTFKPAQAGPHFGTYTGPNGEKAAYLTSIFTRYENTNQPHVIKYVLSNQEPYMTRTGHYVLYEYYRQDGTLEHQKLVKPEVGISASVLTKAELSYFDKDGKKKTEERFVRADGNLGSKHDVATDAWTSYFADGVTVRSKQVYDHKRKQTVEKRYLKNGSLWYSTIYTYTTDGDPMTTVYFDNQGHKLDQPLRFTRVLTKGGFKANGVWYEREAEDHYLRSDGTNDYVQVWYEFQEKDKPWLTEALGQVQVYNSTGNQITATYNLDFKTPDQPIFIRTAQFYLPSGTTLLFRQYSSINHRSKETPYDTDGKQQPAKVFAANDWYEEPIANKMIFQGFDHTVWSTTDANSHDF